jgi:hypothetical protein
MQGHPACVAGEMARSYAAQRLAGAWRGVWRMRERGRQCQRGPSLCYHRSCGRTSQPKSAPRPQSVLPLLGVPSRHLVASPDWRLALPAVGISWCPYEGLAGVQSPGWREVDGLGWRCARNHPPSAFDGLLQRLAWRRWYQGPRCPQVLETPLDGDALRSCMCGEGDKPTQRAVAARQH